METLSPLIEDLDRAEQAPTDLGAAMPDDVAHQNLEQYRGRSVKELLEDGKCPYLNSLIMQNTVEEVATERLNDTIDKVESGRKVLAETTNLASLFPGMPGIPKPEKIPDIPAKS